MVLVQTTFPSFKRDKYTTQGGIVNPYTTNARVDAIVGLSITTSGGSPMSVNATFQGGAISVTSRQDLMPKLAEWHIYGNEQQGRFAIRKPDAEPLYYLDNLTNDVKNKNFFRILDKKEYELKDHLGNVRVAIGDMKLPENEATSTRGVPPFLTDEKTVNDYYPFGMTIAERSYSTAGYRYGYNGKENDNEVKGNGEST